MKLQRPTQITLNSIRLGPNNYKGVAICYWSTLIKMDEKEGFRTPDEAHEWAKKRSRKLLKKPPDLTGVRGLQRRKF